MTIQYNLHSREGLSLLLTLPEPSRIAVPAVREAVEKFAKRAAQHREASAALATADGAVERVRAAIAAEAADAAEDGGSVPAKKLVKKLREAQDALDEARITFEGRDTALRKAHANVRDVIRHHTPAWRAASLDAVDAAVLRVTSAREMLRKAGADLDEALSVLGMLNRIPLDGIPAVIPIDNSAAYVSEALDRIGSAIGSALDSLDREKGAAKSTPDVVVPVPDEDTVDETPATPADEVAFTIGGEDE